MVGKPSVILSVALSVLVVGLSSVSMASAAAEAAVAAVEVGKHANTHIDALSMLLSLAMVLVLIFAAAWLLKKFNVVNKSVPGMRVVANLPLGTKERLVVVEVGEQQLLFGISAKGVELIKTLEQPLVHEQNSAQDLAQPFKQLFKKVNQ